MQENNGSAVDHATPPNDGGIPPQGQPADEVKKATQPQRVWTGQELKEASNKLSLQLINRGVYQSWMIAIGVGDGTLHIYARFGPDDSGLRAGKRMVASILKQEEFADIRDVPILWKNSSTPVPLSLQAS